MKKCDFVWPIRSIESISWPRPVGLEFVKVQIVVVTGYAQILSFIVFVIVSHSRSYPKHTWARRVADKLNPWFSTRAGMVLNSSIIVPANREILLDRFCAVASAASPPKDC